MHRRLLIVLFALTVFAQQQKQKRFGPSFGQQFQTSTYSSNRDDPVRSWYFDYQNQLERIDFFFQDQIETRIFDYKHGIKYYIDNSRKHCTAAVLSGSLSAFGWSWLVYNNGTATINGVFCDEWIKYDVLLYVEAVYYSTVATPVKPVREFYPTYYDTPQWTLDYEDFVYGVDISVFQPPEFCNHTLSSYIA